MSYVEHLKYKTFICILTEAATRGVLFKKVFLEISQNSQENTCARVSFLIKLQTLGNFIKKEALAQVFSCEFCEISKNTFFTEHLWTTASTLTPLNKAYLNLTLTEEKNCVSQLKYHLRNKSSCG